MRSKKALITLSALTILASACVSDDPSALPSENLTSGEISLTSGLVTAADCGQLLSHLKAEGLERVGPYGFGDGGYYGIDVMEEAMEDDASSDEAERPATTSAAEDLAAPEAAGSDGGGEGESFSGTNNQERGVDEPDVVKTDGERLVVVSGQNIQVIDVTGPTPEVAKTIRLGDNFWGGELFLAGDKAFVMTSGWSDTPLNADFSGRYFPGTQTSQILEVDLESGEILRTLKFEGSYISAREVNGIIRVVLTAPVGQNFEFLFPQSQNSEDRATEANKEAIEESTIEQWLPGYRLEEGDDVIESGQMVNCDRVHIPGQFSGFGSMNILTIDPEQGLELLDATSVLSTGQTVYSSTDRLAVATSRPPEFDPQTGEPVSGDQEFRTAIHNFDITDNTSTNYVASGSVPGTMLSQYSLSERDGYLRVATTTEGWWNDGQNQSESFITVLEEAGGELKEVGQVGELGKGERIFAVRFMSDVAYVVTFRQIDPLYTIDLSDPTKPTTTGELKIPGFSNYLHPVGDGFLVGVGQDGTDDGRITGALMSTFDVNDMLNPTRVATMRLAPEGLDGDNSYSDSPVGWNARAFTWWGADRLAIVPVNYHSWNDQSGSTEGSDAVLVKVGATGELTELGRVSHPVTKQCEGGYIEEPELLEDDAASSTDAEADLVEAIEPAPAPLPPIDEGEYCWSYSPYISRTVVIDGNLFSISDGGVGVHQLDGLSEVTYLPFNN